MTRIGLCGFGSRVRLLLVAGAALSLLGVLVLAPMARADGVPLNSGEVLADVGNGQIRHFTNTGTLLDTLNTTTGTTEGDGMCFDGSTNLYATQGFEANAVSEFNQSGNLVTASFGSGYDGHPESCTVNAAGDIFVGQPDGSHDVLEFSPSGTLINTFAPAIQDRGTDWIDLASDQCTLHYTSEGDTIKQFNVCTNTQLPDFATGLPGGTCYGHRILPDGGELVACTSELIRLDSSGNQVQTYNPDPGGFLFAVNLDPDGTTFWTADYLTGQIFRIDIATGAVVNTFTTAPNTVLGGLAIVGELTAAQDARITATGTSVSATEGSSFSGTVATFSDPDSTAQPSDYSATINWGDGTTTTGTISGSPSQFVVSGSHTYSEEGSQTITVTITDTDNPSNTATAQSTATIAAATATVTIPKTRVKAASVSAKLSSVPAACVSKAFTARVQGKRIASVRFTLDGRRFSTTMVRYGRKFSARISVTPGRHRLTVKIKFHRGSAVRSRTFHATVTGCVAALPKFTG